MVLYVLQFASAEHVQFREMELRALAQLAEVALPAEPFVDESRPTLRLDLPDDSAARRLCERSVLLKAVYREWLLADDMAGLCAELQARGPALCAAFGAEQTWRVTVDPMNKKLAQETKLARIAQLGAAGLALPGAVNLRQPDVEVVLLEEWRFDVAAGRPAAAPRQFFLGARVADSLRLRLKEFSLSRRRFIGNTSMDPALAFLMANLGCVQPHQLLYDPFVGSGGLLVAGGFFGARCVGADIDRNTVFGTGRSSRHDDKWRAPDESVRANFAQYGMSSRFVDVLLADSANAGLLRDQPLFDAIVTDPPYGVREAHRCAGADEYRLAQLFLDLVEAAARLLLVGGRLVYWFPVVRATFSAACLPRHPALRLVADALQPLAQRTGRQLVIMEKVAPFEPSQRATLEVDHFAEKRFRDHVLPPPPTVSRGGDHPSSILAAGGTARTPTFPLP